MSNSVSPGKTPGDSGANAAPGMSFGMNGRMAFFSPGALTNRARRSNDSPSKDSARPTASGQSDAPVKSDEPSSDIEFQMGSGVGVSLAAGSEPTRTG